MAVAIVRPCAAQDVSASGTPADPAAVPSLPSLNHLFGPPSSSYHGLPGSELVRPAAVEPEPSPVLFPPGATPVEPRNLSMCGERTSRQPPAPSNRIPVPVDFRRGNTWKKLYADVLQDQASVLRYPLQVARGHHWQPTVAVAAATAGLIALDPRDTPYFRRTTTFLGFNTAASGLNTAAAMAIVPATFYLVSAKRSDSYGTQTVFLAAEAVVDVQIVTLAMKMIDRRIRPSDVSNNNYTDTWFKAGVFDGKSFPSGHTMAAFALADVFAERYKGHRWVRWMGFGLAGVVGVSRLTLQSHFPSDVFAGGILGVLIPHELVLRPSMP
jgi:membrane-associated phospholipid phosphatase